MINKHSSVKYSILELASVSEGVSHQQTFNNCLDLAQKADTMGYFRVWLAEHHNMKSIASSATVVLIGYIAGGTKKIRVGSGGIMLPNHSPLIVAEQFGTLGTLYPGRIDLGLGRAPGTDQETASAIRADRMQAVYHFPDDVNEVMQYFSSDDGGAKVRATVAEGVEVPVYILGSSTDSAHLAAKMGLPYAFASHFAPTHLFDALNIYHNEFQPSEYLQEPYAMAGINVIAADTDATAERLSTSMLRMMLGVLTNKPNYMPPPTEMVPELRELSQHPAMHQFLKYTFTGSRETVKQQTEDFLRQTGVNELIVASHMYHHEDRVNSYRIFSEIMKEVNGG
ncbi:LLM class flavin-dependent oxidoreductase [Cytophagaceae bacterium ABcell3]|nr:LLM class flavin-dependent oxidoreductase [Cytophagaceae bacterium ABcell3]